MCVLQLFFTVIKLTGGRGHQEHAMEQFEELGDKVTPMEFDEGTPQHAHQHVSDTLTSEKAAVGG